MRENHDTQQRVLIDGNSETMTVYALFKSQTRLALTQIQLKLKFAMKTRFKVDCVYAIKILIWVSANPGLTQVQPMLMGLNQQRKHDIEKLELYRSRVGIHSNSKYCVILNEYAHFQKSLMNIYPTLLTRVIAYSNSSSSVELSVSLSISSIPFARAVSKKIDMIQNSTELERKLPKIDKCDGLGYLLTRHIHKF